MSKIVSQFNRPDLENYNALRLEKSSSDDTIARNFIDIEQYKPCMVEVEKKLDQYQSMRAFSVIEMPISCLLSHVK